MERALRARVIGPYGYLAFFVWAVTMAALTSGLRLGWVLLVVLSFSLLEGGRTLSGLAQSRLWLMVVALVASSALLVGEKDVSFAGLMVSSEGFRAGLWMALRAMIIFLAADILVGAISAMTLAQLLEGWGAAGLGFAVGLALNLLPTMQRLVEDVWLALRLRGGLRQERWRAIRLFLVTVTVNALQYGDLAAEAAEARGFSVVRRQRRAIEWRWLDAVLACGLVALSVVLLI
jgi:energy-coupling factor transporter transmembrane protein EcfT